MKILFVGLKVGAGLISICNAVKNEFDKMPGVETDYIDIYSENQKMAKFSSEFYYNLIKHIPRLVAFGQNIGYYSSLKAKRGHYFLNRDVEICKVEMMKFIERYKPDIVFTPVNFVAVAMDELIETKQTNIKYIFQMPDFMIAYYSQLLKHCTYLFSSSEEVSKTLINKNFNQQKLKTTGIPIDKKFYEQYDKEDIKRQLNFNADKYILISNGGAGFANNYKLVRNLHDKIGEYYLIVVNGNNKQSKDKIQNFIDKNQIHNVINLGFVNNMTQLMYISDIMIGKCGSSSLCEASAFGLKYIVLNNNLFPEIKNIKFIKKRKAALIAKNIKGIKKALNIFLNDKIKSEEIVENFKHVNIKNNLQIIKDLILQIDR